MLIRHPSASASTRSITRRTFLGASAAGVLAGCIGGSAVSSVITSAHVWGETGRREGQFERPRAIAAIDGEVFVIDTTSRLQVFDYDGAFKRRWDIPRIVKGTPTAITPAPDGRLLIPDTHDSRLLEYDRDGALLTAWGEYGTGEDEFIYPTDVVLDDDGRYIVSEYGMNAERVHIFSADRTFEAQWGELGEAPGQFARAMAIARPSDGHLYVCDTANHRIQCFNADGEVQRVIGGPGSQPGELKFPYDIDVGPDDSLLVCEYGNNRLSRFKTDGTLIGCRGRAGRAPGEFNAPRGAAVSPEGLVFVADTNNDRVQRFPLEAVG